MTKKKPKVVWVGDIPITPVTAALWRYHPNAPIASLNEALAQEFLVAWRDRWTQVPNLIRRVVKP